MIHASSRSIRWIGLGAAALAILLGASPAQAELRELEPDTAVTADPVNPAAPRLAVGTVKPAAVTTAAVEIPAELLAAAVDSVSFRIDPVGEVRVYGATAGVLRGADLRDGLLLVTFSVPRGLTAGPATLAHVEFEAGSGARWTGELAGTVETEARLQLDVAPIGSLVLPGATLEVEFAVTNLGNAAELVQVELEGPSGWVLESTPPPLRLIAGQRESGVMRLRVAQDAIPGDRLLVSFVGRGRGAVTRAHFPVEIGIPPQAPNYNLPLRIFAGAGRAPGAGSELSGSWAVSGRGEVLDGATLSIDARSTGGLAGRTAFARELSGPAFRATLETDRWQLSAGEIHQAEDAVIGAFLNGQGASGSWASGSTVASATAVRTGMSGVDSGHLVSGNVAVATPVGLLGFSARGEEVHTLLDGTSSALQGGAVTFSRGSTSDLRVNASTGMVRIAGEGESTLSPTASAELQHSSDGGYLSLRARHTPEEARRFRGRSSGLFAGGAIELGRGVAATGWYSRDALGERPEGGIGQLSAGSAGLRMATGPVQAAVRATTTSTPADLYGGEGGRRNAAAVDLSGAVGGVFGSVTAEHAIGSSSVIDYLQGSLQWQTGRSWTSLAGTYSAPLANESVVRLDLVQTFDLGRTRLEIAAGGDPGSSARQTLNARARAEIDAGRDISIVLGAEYAPLRGNGAPLGLSLGISRKLSVGLPTRRPAGVSGIAFHDVDGDGIRGANEPAFAGLMLRRGNALAVTSATGAFELAGPRDAAITVDPASLPAGALVAPAVLANPYAGMQIPVVQAAQLEVGLFLDGNGNGVRDEGESVLPGMVVTLEDAAGSLYSEATDAAGQIRYRAIAPGAYVARVAADGDFRTVEVPVHLTSGGSIGIEIPVRRIEREVRFVTPPAGVVE